MAQFVFTLFGTFDVLAGDESVRGFRTDKERALLAYLALEAERPVSRSTLVNLFWSEMGETRARDNLRKTLHRLRHTLDVAVPNTATPDAAASNTVIPGSEQLLTITRQTIQFNQANAFVDVQAFQTLLTATNTHDHEALQLCAACLAQLEEATTLYQGELLAGFSIADAPVFEEWLLLRRELVQQQALLTHNLLATAHESAGDYQRAHAVANRLLGLDPYREDAYRQVMRLLAQMGQPNQALQLLEQMRQLFRTELDVEPSTEILALARAIAAGDYDKMTKWQGGKVTSAIPVTPSPRPAESSAALTRSLMSKPHPVTLSPSLDLHEVPDPGPFFGRADERQQIANWLLHDRCRLVAILGIGGLGKTSLAAHSVRELASAANFDMILWRSLLNAPPLAELLPPLLQMLSDQQLTDVPDSLDEQLRLLLDYLHNKRVLLVLDNLESILEAEKAGVFRPGYEAYEQLIQQVATREHSSHLLLTSRERPRGYARLEGDSQLVQTLQLGGLDDAAGRALLAQRGLPRGGDEETTLIARYSGNPLALKLVADTVEEIFGGDIAEFLAEEALVFDDIRAVLDQQFARLSALEQEILFWLAVEREPTPIALLRRNLLHPPTQRTLVEALRSLQRRSLIEHQGAAFALQNVVTEYLTDRLVAAACEELESGDVDLLHRHALLKAQAKAYVRESQARLILTPIGVRLSAHGGSSNVPATLQAILKRLRQDAPGVASYAGGTIVNLLLQLGLDMTGLDFSHLSVWQAHLQGAVLPGVDFTAADLTNATFTNNFGRVKAVTMSPDSKLLALGTDDGEIRLWDLTNGQLVGMLHRHPGLVVSLAFSPDSRRLVSSSVLESNIYIWDVASGQVLHTLSGHEGGVTAVAFSPDGKLVASGGEDRTLRLWDAGSGRLRCITGEQKDWVESVVFHPNGELLANSNRGQTTCLLWRIQRIPEKNQPSADGFAVETQQFAVLDGHQGSVLCAAFSPDGSLFATGSEDHTICLWDVMRKELVQVLQGHEGTVRSVTFSPDGRWLASGSHDFTVRLWEVAGGQIVDVLRQHTHHIWAVAISGDGSTLASGGSDGVVYLWDLQAGQPRVATRALQGYTKPIYALAVSPDGAYIATGEGAGVVRLWEIEYPHGSLRTRRIFVGHSALVDDLTFSPDGRWLATASHDQTVRLWDVESGECIETIHQEMRHGIHVAFHPQGQLLACSAAHTISLWSVNDRGRCQPVALLTGHTDDIRRLHFSPSGEYLASCCSDGTARLWALSTRECLYVFDKYEGGLWSVDISSRGEFMAVGGRSGIFMWDIRLAAYSRRSYNDIVQMTGTRSIAFSADTKLLVSSGTDRLVRVWDVETGAQLHSMAGHLADVTAIAFLPDTNIVVSGGYDGTLRLWDIHSGQCLHTVRLPGPYEGMNITGVTGISDAQRAALKALGAVEE